MRFRSVSERAWVQIPLLSIDNSAGSHQQHQDKAAGSHQPKLQAFGVAQRKRGGPITLRSLDRNQAPKFLGFVLVGDMEGLGFGLVGASYVTFLFSSRMFTRDPWRTD